MKFHVRDTLIWNNFNVDAFLRLSAAPDIRAPVKELFLASAYLLSLAGLGPPSRYVKTMRVVPESSILESRYAETVCTGS